VVEAEKFILVDPAGNRRALLWFRDEDSPALEFFTTGGKLRASVGMLSYRSTHSPMPSGKGVDPAVVALVEEPSPTLALFDEQGACRIQVSAWRGWPSLSFTDQEGKECGYLGLLGRFGGSPGLMLGGLGEGRVKLLGPPEGPAVSLTDGIQDGGKLRAVLGRTSLETTRTGEVQTLPASSLVLFDKEGKVMFQEP
jgi:hypothetical protein